MKKSEGGLRLTDREERHLGRILKPMIQDEKALRMKQFIQHGEVTTFDHGVRVARLSYLLARRLHMTVDEEELVTGAFLHDYYLYDWHDHGDHLHGYHHADISARNARRDFRISGKAEHIIKSHMWPLNLTRIPRSKEALLVCIADKMCSVQESVHRKHAEPENQSHSQRKEEYFDDEFNL